jgi:hypothetical protein
MKNKTHYRRNLPHIQPKGALFFVTWILAGAITREKIILLEEEYQQRIKHFTKKSLYMTFFI